MPTNRLSRRAFLGTLSAAALVGCSGSGQSMFNSYMGRTPPSLKAKFATWINGQPVDWPELKGKVVFVTFSFLQ